MIDLYAFGVYISVSVKVCGGRPGSDCFVPVFLLNLHSKKYADFFDKYVFE